MSRNAHQPTEPEAPLPEGWRWARLAWVCEINPSRPRGFARDDNTPTTFVPMSAVDEVMGAIVRPELRPYRQVRKGYTYFEEGDVLFAKITPCMQNGKHAIATGLRDGIGFGSTEFHVLRPSTDLTSEWVHGFLLQPWVLNAATAHFTGAVGQQRVPEGYLGSLEIPLPPLSEQKRIAAILNEQMAAIARARAAAETQISLLQHLLVAYLRLSLSTVPLHRRTLGECLVQVSQGIGASWKNYRLVGATRAGIAPAKENVGKRPERYKLVNAGTIFYNPMRILLGSIAMTDDGEEPGITSPDYVVFKTREGTLHPGWFYYWLRSQYGEAFIKTLVRGAVRERMLFRRLASAELELPPWSAQLEVAAKLAGIKKMKSTLGGQLQTINKLPSGLLRQAFSGNI